MHKKFLANAITQLNLTRYSSQLLCRMSRTQSPARGTKDNLHGRLIFDLGETRKFP